VRLAAAQPTRAGNNPPARNAGKRWNFRTGKKGVGSQQGIIGSRVIMSMMRQRHGESKECLKANNGVTLSDTLAWLKGKSYWIAKLLAIRIKFVLAGKSLLASRTKTHWSPPCFPGFFIVRSTRGFPLPFFIFYKWSILIPANARA